MKVIPILTLEIYQKYRKPVSILSKARLYRLKYFGNYINRYIGIFDNTKMEWMFQGAQCDTHCELLLPFIVNITFDISVIVED